MKNNQVEPSEIKVNLCWWKWTSHNERHHT